MVVEVGEYSPEGGLHGVSRYVPSVKAVALSVRCEIVKVLQDYTGVGTAVNSE